MALTASATNEQRSEIIRLIKLRNPVISNGSVDRPNLMLSVLEKSLYPTMIQRFKMLIDQIKKKPLDSTIIYAITRKEVESITGIFNV